MALNRKDLLKQFADLRLVYNYTGVGDPKRFGFESFEWVLDSINGKSYPEFLLILNRFFNDLKAIDKKDILQFVGGVDVNELEQNTRELVTLLKQETDLQDISERLKYSKGQYLKVGIISSIAFKKKGSKRGSEPINNIWLNQQAYDDIGEVSYILKQMSHYFQAAIEAIKSTTPTTRSSPVEGSKKGNTLHRKPPYNFVSARFTEDKVELLFDLLCEAGYLKDIDSQKKSFIAGFSKGKAVKKISPVINWTGYSSHLRYLIFHHLTEVEPSYKEDKDLRKSRWCTAELLFTVKGKATKFCEEQDRGNYPKEKLLKKLKEAFQGTFQEQDFR
jgi:hypothetical protein